MRRWMDEWSSGGRGGGRARPSLSEDRLMWVSERTPERNSPLFDSQLSDRPSGLAVHGRHPHTPRKWVSNTGLTPRGGQLEY